MAPLPPGPEIIAAHRLSIAESIHGTWYYHLRSGSDHRSLCGGHVMHTAVPLSAWGTTSHLNERWCSQCAALAGRLKA